MTDALPEFTIIRPACIKEAVQARTNDPSARIFAGGTDLIVNMRRGLVEADTLINLSNLQQLHSITSTEAGVVIGATVSVRELTENREIAKAYPALASAANAIAGPSHREAATVGGNLCLDTRCLYYNQSHWWRKSNDFCLKYRGDICHVAPNGNRCRAAFCGDLAPALMVHGAEVELVGPNGSRRLPLAQLYREDGKDYLTLAADEILTQVYVPPPRATSAYGKIRVRGTIDFPLAGVAVAAERHDGATLFTLAFTGTNSCPIITTAPATLKDGDPRAAFFARLGKLAQKTVSPQRTTTIQPHYRRLAIAALTMRLAQGLV